MSEEQWTAIDEYLSGLFAPHDAAMQAGLAASEAAGLPSIAVSPVQGKFLMMLAQMRDARRILEIGTLGGYSTTWLARALPPDGQLITLEMEPKHAEVARANLARAGLADRVQVRVGPALESLKALAAEDAGPFDLVFIDADKESVPEYFEATMKLSRRGTLIVVDNVIRRGRILDAPDQPDIAALRRFNKVVAADPRVATVALQTVGCKGHDGLALVLVTAEP